jgi:hypothetical protein
VQCVTIACRGFLCLCRGFLNKATAVQAALRDIKPVAEQHPEVLTVNSRHTRHIDTV